MGVLTGAQLADKFLPGDSLVVAVGAPYRWLVGDAALASRYRVLDELTAEEADPEAEDDKIVALMNSRRTSEGKPLLTAAQEQQVRENRRSQRPPRHT